MKLLNFVLGYLVISLFGSFIFNLLLGHPGEKWLTLRLVVMGIILIPYVLIVLLASIDSTKRKTIYKWLGTIVAVIVVVIIIISFFGSNAGGGVGYGILAAIFIGIPALIVFVVASILARFIHSTQSRRITGILTFFLLTLIILNIVQFFTLAGLFE